MNKILFVTEYFTTYFKSKMTMLLTAASPPPPPTAGLSFNASFGSYMVLQQQPAKACVYGMLGDGGTAASVKLKIGRAHV
jgi:hypothetical protein